MTSSFTSIKVGFCVAYDWELLRWSIPAIYSGADKIVLSVDRTRTTWSGTTYELDSEKLRVLVREIDADSKIEIHEGDFYQADCSPMENERRQRHAIAAVQGSGGWHIQLDCDEVFGDFDSFVRRLRAFSPRGLTEVSVPWIHLYKKVESGYLYVVPDSHASIEWIQIATRFPAYSYGRRSDRFDQHWHYPLVHISWARSAEEIWEKLNGWGHSRDLDIKAYFERWRGLDGGNYKELYSFHPVEPRRWQRLGLIQSLDLNEVVRDLNSMRILPLSKWKLWLDNSIWWSRLRKLLRRTRRFLGLSP